MTAFVARAYGQDVALHVPVEVAVQVAWLAEPWIEVRPDSGGGGDRSTVVLAGNPPPGADALRQSSAPLEGEPPRRLLVDDAERCVTVVERDPQWQVLQVLRAVRNLLRWSFLASGKPCLHAGVVDLGGAGVVVVGGKRAGKTSTVLALLGLGGAFVANDDAGLIDDGGGWLAVGWPRSVNVRTDAHAVLATNPRLRRLRALPERSTHPSEAHRPLAGASLPDFTVLPHDLCSLLGVETRARVPVQAIVLPRFADGLEPVLRRLPDGEAAAALVPHVDRVATDHDGILHGWFRARTSAEAEVTAERLAASIPCYRLTQTLGTAAAAAELVMEIATLVPTAHPSMELRKP